MSQCSAWIQIGGNVTATQFKQLVEAIQKEAGPNFRCTYADYTLASVAKDLRDNFNNETGARFYAGVTLNGDFPRIEKICEIEGIQYARYDCSKNILRRFDGEVAIESQIDERGIALESVDTLERHLQNGTIASRINIMKRVSIPVPPLRLLNPLDARTGCFNI